MPDDNLFADVKDHNGPVWDNDAFELFLKPARDKPGYFEFEVNPANTRLELFIPKRAADGDSYTPNKNKHPFKTQTAVQLNGTLNNPNDKDTAWTVEGKIRWADLAPAGGRPAPNESWQFSLCRVDYLEPDRKGKYELSTISPLTKRDFHRHEEYATIRFAPPAGKPFGIEKRTQWENTNLRGSPDPPPPYQTQPAFTQLKIHQPCFVQEEPGTKDLLVVQHLGPWAGPGKIVRVQNTPHAKSAQTLLDLDEIIYAIALHPNYTNNHYLYTGSNGPLTAKKKINSISRWKVDPKTKTIDPTSRLRIIEWESDGHNGLALEFGPDRMLWFTGGDTSSDSDTANRGQDTTNLWSALGRIDVDHAADSRNYSIPKDNPFINVEGIRPEIYAHGLRNPWRMAFDAKTGTLWVAQNGQDLWEPVYAVKKGANYGWPVYEGSKPFHPHRKLNPLNPKFTPPTLEHHHSEARSLTGGIVYHGPKYPDLRGAYLYGDFSTGKVWAAWYDNKNDKVTKHIEIARTTLQITNFATDSTGEIFISCDATGIHKLTRRVGSAHQLHDGTFPTQLSQTGLFTNTAQHQPHPALIPYDVNSPLWSDHAQKTRYLALPGTETISYTPTRGWNFPDYAVTVKTFSINLDESDPASQRRLETRIMIKHPGQNWAGYTYIWNDEQTEATLAPAQGADQPLTIRTKDGSTREQTWRYPSRAECLVCHSRAANFALGLSELQMNRDFTYPSGVTDNQLRTLEHLGVLQTDYPEQLKKPLQRDFPDRKLETLLPQKDQRQFPTSALLPKPPEKLSRLPNPADESADLTARARSYLHANCYHCHVEAGGGNASVDLEFTTDLKRSKLFDSPPQHSTFGLPNAKMISPGHPDQSILYHRMTHRGPNTGQMPPIGTNEPDPLGKALIADWIRKMPPQ
jgi:uncharacterized repeat protein (TIGR03806 family)